MILDINDNDFTNIDCEYDICIIGAGLSGLYISNNINNKKIAIVEAGNFSQKSEIKTVNLNNEYNGAISGRHFGVAGTSNIWGGQLYRLSESDYNSEYGFNENNIFKSYNEYKNYCDVVEFKLFKRKVSDFYDKQLELFCDRFNLVFTKWLPLTSRVFTYVDKQETHLYINSPCIDFEFHNNYIRNITIKSKSGKCYKISAKKFIIAAGAIESTRLLLLLNAKYNLIRSSTLGQGLTDHLSVIVGRVKYKNLNSKTTFSNRFFDGVMRSLRYEYNNKLNLNKISAYIHFVEINNYFSLIDIIKYIFGFSIKHKKISISIFYVVIIDFLLLMYYRIFCGKLFPGLKSETNVVLDLTQLRNLSNKIYLSEQKDNLGIPMVNIDWKISENDVENIYKIISDFRLSNKNLLNNELFEIIFFDKININKSIYHPYGTTILGQCQNNTVVDHNLKVSGTSNLYCVSTSNFHNIGCANPTLTQLACIEKFIYIIDNDK